MNDSEVMSGESDGPGIGIELRVAERTRELAEANERLRAEIARRERSEIGARQTDEQFRLLVQGVVDYAIFLLDTNGRVSTWNPGAERIKGYTADEIIGRHFSVFYLPDARAAGEPRRVLRQAAEQGRVEVQGWRVRKDGSRFWASVVIDRIYDAAGEIVGFAKITRDITEQRNAAEALEQAREALFQAQKMESIGQLTGGIAHDFNNMLAGIVGAIQILERRIADGRYDGLEKYLTAALESANRAAALTSRLLAFGRRQSLDVKSVDLIEAVRSMELILRHALGENITLALDLGAEPIAAATDMNQLQSTLLNLALNARDAMPGGGKMIVTVRAARLDPGQAARGSGLKEGDYALLTVADTGVGMAADVLARAFDPFFTTKPIGAGTGLGLSMVHGFVKQTGGHIAIESEPGRGTRVSIWLPAAGPPAPKEAVREAPSPEGRGEVVLVVEDEALVRMLLLDVLGELGYEAHEARDAQHALPLIESSARLDLLITDVGLPGMNGRQLADIARARRPDLKILFLTGYAEHAGVRASFLGPQMDLVTKPFEMDKLAQKIQHMLAEG